MSVTVEGIEQTLTDIQAKFEKRKQKVKKAIDAGALKVLSSTSESLKSGNKSGKTYKRGDKIHIASAAGEAPAKDKGNLDDSLYNVQVDAWTREVGASAAYAKALEFGTSKMLPRPFLVPAMEKHRREIEKAILEAAK